MKSEREKYLILMTSLVAQMVKRLPTMRETRVQSLGREDLEKEMATHSSILAWKIPWTEEPGRLQSMGSPRVGPNGATSLSLSFRCMCLESRKMLLMNLFEGQQWRRRHRKQTCGHSRGRRGRA